MTDHPTSLGDERIAEIRLVIEAARAHAHNDSHWKPVNGPAYFKTNLARDENRRKLWKAIESSEAALTTLQAEVEAREQAAQREHVASGQGEAAEARPTPESPWDSGLPVCAAEQTVGNSEPGHALVDSADKASAHYTSGTTEVPELSEESKRWYARQRVSEAAGDARICPQDGSTCWGACEVSYCRGYADARETVEQALEAAEQKIKSLTARAIVAEQHKTLELLSEGSATEQLEMRLREKLAEAELRAEAAEQRITALEGALRAKVAEWRQYIAEEDNDEWGRERASTLSDAADELEALIDPGGQK
jgi:hypothetical protein